MPDLQVLLRLAETSATDLLAELRLYDKETKSNTELVFVCMRAARRILKKRHAEWRCSEQEIYNRLIERLSDNHDDILLELSRLNDEQCAVRLRREFWRCLDEMVPRSTNEVPDFDLDREVGFDLNEFVAECSRQQEIRDRLAKLLRKVREDKQLRVLIDVLHLRFDLKPAALAELLGLKGTELRNRLRRLEYIARQTLGNVYPVRHRPKRESNTPETDDSPLLTPTSQPLSNERISENDTQAVPSSSSDEVEQSKDDASTGKTRSADRGV